MRELCFRRAGVGVGVMEAAGGGGGATGWMGGRQVRDAVEVGNIPAACASACQTDYYYSNVYRAEALRNRQISALWLRALVVCGGACGCAAAAGVCDW